MPLEKTTVSVNFAQGVDTKTDPKQVAGSLLRLVNGVLTSPGRVRKKPGTRALGQGTAAGSITTGRAICTYRDELLEFDGVRAYSYDSRTDSWVDRGAVSSVYPQVQPIVRSAFAQTCPDCATHASGLQALAWEDASGGVWCLVRDSATGLQVLGATQVSASGRQPKVVAVGNHFLVFFVVGQNLYYSEIGVASPGAPGAPVLVAGSLTAGQTNYDATSNGRFAFVAYNKSDGNVGAASIGPTLVLSAEEVWTGPALSIATFLDATGNICIAWYDGTSVRWTAWDGIPGNLLSAPATAETIANVASITGAATGSEPRSFRLWYSVSSSTKSQFKTRSVAVLAGILQAPADVLRSVGLAGKAFAFGGTDYAICAFDASAETNLQSTLFVVDSAGNVVARLLSGLSGGLPTRTLLPGVNADGEGGFTFAAVAKENLTTEGGALFSPTGVNLVSLDFADPEHSYQRQELADTLHLSGGFLQMYDGAAFTEDGFHLYPEGLAVPGAAGTYSYQYAACFEWVDARGQLHRSAPSVPVTQKQANPIDGGHTVAVTIPTLRVTSKRGVAIVLYRTAANVASSEQVFYRVTSVTSPLANDPTVDTVTFTDVTTDAALVSGVQLYTLGGVLANIPPPPCAVLALHQNRIYLVSAENPLQIWYSKQLVPGWPVEFSDFLTIDVDPRGGPVTALASLEDKLAALKGSAVFVQAGTEADDTGANAGFSPWREIAVATGCSEPRSIVRVTEGVFLKSNNGIYLLDGNLQVGYVGARVEAFNEQTITSAVAPPGVNQVRFGLDGGNVLVFDTFAKQWGWFEGVNAVDACCWQGLYTYVRADGQVRQETPGAFPDAGNSVKMSVTTSWLQLAGLQGFQRVYRLMVLGEYVSAHRLRVKVAYNFNPNPEQDVTIDAGSLLDAGTYGSDALYGDNVYGGQFPLYQFGLRLDRQKCQAIQVTIEVEGPDECMSLSAIGFEVGVKRGLNKLPATRHIQ